MGLFAVLFGSLTLSVAALTPTSSAAPNNAPALTPAPFLPWMDNCRAASVADCNSASYPDYCIPCQPNIDGTPCVVCTVSANWNDYLNNYGGFISNVTTFAVLSVLTILLHFACWPVCGCLSARFRQMDRFLATLPAVPDATFNRKRRFRVVMVTVFSVAVLAVMIPDVIYSVYLMNDAFATVSYAVDAAGDIAAAAPDAMTVINDKYQSLSPTSITASTKTATDAASNALTEMVSFASLNLIPIQTWIQDVQWTAQSLASMLSWSVIASGLTAVSFAAFCLIIIGAAGGRALNCGTYFVASFCAMLALATRFAALSGIFIASAAVQDVQTITQFITIGTPFGDYQSRMPTVVDGLCATLDAYGDPLQTVVGTHSAILAEPLCESIVAFCSQANVCTQPFTFDSVASCVTYSGPYVLENTLKVDFAGGDSIKSCYEDSYGPCSDPYVRVLAGNVYTSAELMGTIAKEHLRIQEKTRCFGLFPAPTSDAAQNVMDRIFLVQANLITSMAVGCLLCWFVICMSMGIFGALMSAHYPIPVSAEALDAAYAYAAVETASPKSAAPGVPEFVKSSHGITPPVSAFNGVYASARALASRSTAFITTIGRRGTPVATSPLLDREEGVVGDSSGSSGLARFTYGATGDDGLYVVPPPTKP